MPIDSTLIPTQWNETLQIVRIVGLNPNEFVQAEESENTGYNMHRISVLTHTPTGFFFMFRPHGMTFCPGERTKTETLDTDERSWNSTRSPLATWLERVRREYEAPDLWAMARQDHEFMQLTTVVDAINTPFTEPEQQYIGIKLDEMRDFVLASLQLDDSQRQLVEAQIEYTKEATKRLGRVDWKNVVVGTLMGLVTGLGTSAVFGPERARELFHMASNAFAPLYRVLVGLNL